MSLEANILLCAKLLHFQKCECTSIENHIPFEISYSPLLYRKTNQSEYECNVQGLCSIMLPNTVSFNSAITTFLDVTLQQISCSSYTHEQFV